MSRAAATLAACAFLAACAPALREPPTLDEMTGKAASAGDVETTLVRADGLWHERTLDSVSEAEELYLQAAGGDRRRIEGWTGAARAGVWLANHQEDPDERERAATAVVTPRRS